MSHSPALTLVASFCQDNDIAVELGQDSLILTIPGTNRHRITIMVTSGDKYLRIQSFVARNPDENHEQVYRWLLEQNARLLVVSYSVDRYGDIYLAGAVPIESVTADLIDAVLGVVVHHADESFNVLLELGFRSAIEREWAWRNSRGLDTANLAAFQHLLDNDSQS